MNNRKPSRPETKRIYGMKAGKAKNRRNEEKNKKLGENDEHY